MKILVTGGAGFLGSHLCERLLSIGHEVICIDNYYTGSKENVQHLLSNPRFETIRHDVTFPIYLEVDGIFNLACPASPVHYQRNPVQTLKTNVHGAINILGLAKRTHARVLQASTSEIYGNPSISPQPEEYWGNVNPIGIRSCYDEGKRAAETLFFDYVNETSLPKGAEIREEGLDKIYEYLEAIYSTIIEKDITQRHKINDKRAFNNIAKFMASNIGSALSPNNISKILKSDGQTIHHSTVEKYLDYLIESFVFYKVNRFDLRGRKQLTTQEKYYLVDVGLLNILMGKDRTRDRGHILENIVYLELLRRGNKIWTGTDRNSEVDFVYKTPVGDINYIQVAWLLSDEKTIEREFGALEKIRDNYPKLLLTTDSYTQSRDGIKHQNVFHWLLDLE